MIFFLGKPESIQDGVCEGHRGLDGRQAPHVRLQGRVPRLPGHIHPRHAGDHGAFATRHLHRPPPVPGPERRAGATGSEGQEQQDHPGQRVADEEEKGRGPVRAEGEQRHRNEPTDSGARTQAEPVLVRLEVVFAEHARHAGRHGDLFQFRWKC